MNRPSSLLSQRPSVFLTIATPEPGALDQVLEADWSGAGGVEWRLDQDHVVHPALLTADGNKAGMRVAEGIKRIRQKTGIPVCLTLRTADEGGAISLSRKNYGRFLRQLVEQKAAEMIDVEWRTLGPESRRLFMAAQRQGILTIGSRHEQRTPSDALLHQLFARPWALGASIAKVAVLPASVDDVLRLIAAAREAKRRQPDGALVALSMGAAGIWTRLGALTGSVMTFATLDRPMAPGQRSLHETVQLLDLIYSSDEGVQEE